MALLCLIFNGLESYGQDRFVQTVKGTIIDEDSNFPIIGANVIILDSDPLLGGSTDIEGNFVIKNVPIGRITLVISNMGYEQRVIPNIVVGTGKEVVINGALKESLVKLDEIVVLGKENKSDVSNEMVLVGGRTFSVEETNRYAGTLNDPARAVASFAGIQSNAEGSNHIIVRGNSPNTVQWKMEGIEIPNPNHFAEEGAAGGSINILNAKNLANSDFYTGAFTSEYSNVLGGVFDMKMRTGNRDTREYSVGVGILGTDISLEGPFKKGGKSSYLVNYRYSTLGLLDDLGIVDFGGVPRYQDVAFKLSFPTKSAGQFKVFGVGGLSSIREDIEDEDTEEITGRDDFFSSMGSINLSHLYFFNNNTSIESYASFSQNGSGFKFDEIEEGSDEFERTFTDRLNRYTLNTGTTVLSKINSQNTIKSGVKYRHFIFDFEQEYLNSRDILETTLADEGDAGELRAFVSWKHRFNDQWVVTTGVNYLNFLLNNSQVIEPRASVKYKLKPNQSIFAGFGVHSQLASLPVYYSIIQNEDGTGTRSNLDLDLMKAVHYVVGYDRQISRNLYFKAEAYYQDLFDIPVENDQTSSYSIINAVSGFTDRALVNEGTGVNYGVELTLERYLNNNYYFLLTGSFYTI